MKQLGTNKPPEIDGSDEEFDIGDDYSWLLKKVLDDEEGEYEEG